ncbi:hypothetical protein D3C84_1252510 [compost metagenome]
MVTGFETNIVVVGNILVEAQAHFNNAIGITVEDTIGWVHRLEFQDYIWRLLDHSTTAVVNTCAYGGITGGLNHPYYTA